MRAKLLVLILAVLLVCAPSCVQKGEQTRGCAGGSNDSPQPNIYLLTIDALRPDHLGIYGYDRPTSPKLDAFAARGVVFEQAITQASYTVPSVASLLTGNLPLFHGEKHSPVPFRDDNLTLAELLTSVGYDTAAFVDNGILNGMTGWDQGFAEYVCLDADEAQDLYKLVVSWMDRPRDRPFFLWTHFLDPHAPYKGRDAYRELFASPTDTRDWIKGDEVDNDAIRWNQQQTRNALNLYDGEIRYLDDYLGKIFSRLEKSGLLETTVVIVTADHGESFMEHGHKSHGFDTYEENIRVPLIVVYPGISNPGRRLPQMVRLIDLFPTIAALARTDPGKVQGQSLLPLLEGRPGWTEQYAVTQASSGDFSIRSSEGKLMRMFSDGSYLWLNLDRDPGEKNPVPIESLKGRDREKADRMWEALEGYIRAWQYSKPELPTKLDGETLEALRSLGYIR